MHLCPEKTLSLLLDEGNIKTLLKPTQDHWSKYKRPPLQISKGLFFCFLTIIIVFCKPLTIKTYQTVSLFLYSPYFIDCPVFRKLVDIWELTTFIFSHEKGNIKNAIF